MAIDTPLNKDKDQPEKGKNATGKERQGDILPSKAEGEDFDEEGNEHPTH
jgi:hypothetical protein